MTIIQAIIFGLVQGFCEFLPISSSGHLVLASRIMGVENNLTMDLMLHLATLSAVMVVMRKEVFGVARYPLGKKSRLIVLSTIMTVVVVLIVKGAALDSFDGSYLALTFALTAALLLVGSMIEARRENITALDSMIVGVAQGIAAFPGLSRSGSTIVAAKLTGVEQSVAARYSFLISIPIIIGSAAADIIGGGSLTAIGWLPLTVGCLTAFVSGTIALRFMIRHTGESMRYFALYLIALSVFVIVNDFWLKLF